MKMINVVFSSSLKLRVFELDDLDLTFQVAESDVDKLLLLQTASRDRGIKSLSRREALETCDVS